MKQRITRRAQRYPVHLEINSLNGKPAGGSFIVDLSALGAKLESSTPLSPRHQVEFTFTLPGCAAETKAVGTVVWMRPLLTAPGRYHMGIKFFNSVWEIDQMGRSGQLR
jgi:hypothetical protein